jgi:transposase
MAKKYRVTLTRLERNELEQLLSAGKADVRRLSHARILMKSDESKWGPAWLDSDIADAFDVSVATVERVRRRFVEEGLELALSPYRQPRRTYKRKLDGDQEAKLIAIACSTPPEGHGRWSLRMIADKMVELEFVDELSHETVRQTLKKTSSSLI